MDIELLLESRCGNPLPMPSSFFPQASFSDDISMLVARQVQIKGLAMPGLRLGLNYTDQAGNDSKRTIRVFRMIWLESHYCVYGVCELRQEFRQFRSDRMSELVDWRTGEIVADATVYLHELAEAALSAGETAWDAINAGIIILAAVATVDRMIHDEEIEAIIAFASDAAMNFGIDLDEKTARRIRRTILAACPTVEMVRDALRHIRTFPPIVRLVKRSIRDVSERDDHLSLEEQYLVSHLTRLLDSPYVRGFT